MRLLRNTLAALVRAGTGEASFTARLARAEEMLERRDWQGAVRIARELIDLIANKRARAWRDQRSRAARFGAALAASGGYLAAGEAALEDAARCAERVIGDEAARERRRALLALLGLDRASPVEWNVALAERVLRPWLAQALGSGCYEDAFELEQDLYSKVTVTKETEAHFRRCVSLWWDLAADAGRRLGSEPAPLAPGALPRIAFFLHSPKMLAHVRTLLGMLEGLARLRPAPIEPVVYVFYSFSAELDTALAAHGVRVVYIDRAGKGGLRGGYAKLLELRARLAADRVDALVWVSVVTMMAFAFGMRIAPVQIWWAMKYHSVELPEIDGYLTGGGVSGGIKTIAGRRWRVGPVAAADWFAPQLAQPAREKRAALGVFRVVFASLAREEKLRNPAFLQAVARILRELPDAAFLWTGRERLAEVQEQLEALGVAQRCFFIGWVDTRLYAQVIDVFLDTFPAPCGFTLYEAMAAARPVVLYACPESENNGLHALVAPLFAREEGTEADWRSIECIFRPDGEKLYLRAASVEEYVAYALRLARDPGFRQRAGEAGRAFVQAYMSDRERVARIYAEHLIAILRDTAARRHSS